MNVDDKIIGAVLADLRRERGRAPGHTAADWRWYGHRECSRAELARLVGVARQTVSYIEAGKRSLGVAELWTWAAALETTPEQILARVAKQAAAGGERKKTGHVEASAAPKRLARKACPKCGRDVACRNDGTCREHVSPKGKPCKGR